MENESFAVPFDSQPNDMHLKVDGWKTSFLVGYLLGRYYIRFREGNDSDNEDDDDDDDDDGGSAQSTTFTTCWTRHSATTLAACWEHPSLQYVCDKHAGSRAWITRRSIVCNRHVLSYFGQLSTRETHPEFLQVRSSVCINPRALIASRFQKNCQH